MTFKLFDDQAEFVHKLRQAVAAGHKSILGVASPAFGKTVVAGYITDQARQKSPDATVWFLVHRKNLLRQTSQSFFSAGIGHGLITSGRARTNLPVQIGTIGTVYSRLKQLEPPRVLFIDEAHLSLGNMFRTVAEWVLKNGGLLIGLTGTPERLDGQPLRDLYEVMIEAKSTRWLIDQGRLSDYRVFSTPTEIDLRGVKTTGGDYNKKHLAEAMDKTYIVGNAVSHWRKYANGMITVCYCVGVEHSMHTAQAFNNAGIPAVHVDASTTETELKDACEGLADGRYKVLCNCELVIEGFDLSAQVGRDITLECCILLRPTQSKARYLQMVFRALRRKPHKAVILDHAGCVVRHGLPDDNHDWSLDGREKGERNGGGEADIFTTQCEACYHVFRSGPLKCPNCGTPVKEGGREGPQEIDGELEEIDLATARKERNKQQAQARDLESLIRVGMSRNMKRPAQWAAFIIASRQKRKPTSLEFDAASKAYKKILRETA